MCRVIDERTLTDVRLQPEGWKRTGSARRRSGAARVGLAFEAATRRALAQTGLVPTTRWIAFRDSAGPGVAAPDAFVHPLADGSILVVEAKLSLHLAAAREAEIQLTRLYGPLLRALFGVPLRLLALGRYAGADGPRTRPVAELSLADLGDEPTFALWPAGRSRDNFLRATL